MVRRALVLIGLLAACLPAAAGAVVVPASAGATGPLPLPEGRELRHATRALARLAPARIVVGASDLVHARTLARLARRSGAGARVFAELAAVEVTGPRLGPLVRALAADPRVRYVEESRQFRSFADPFDTVDSLTGIGYLWAADAINAPAALAAIGGITAFPIAVVDTGLDVGHADLAGRVVATYNSVDGSTDVTDVIGHGTFVAGLIAAIDGNGVGIRGAGGGTPILGAKASTPDGAFGEPEIARAIVWAVESGARVVNLSLGGACPSGTPLVEAMNYASARGVLLVAASGNNALSGNTPNCPAYELGGLNGDWGVGLSVGAVKPDGLRGSFSTYNDRLSVAAPGASGSDCRFGVFSTIPAATGIWDDPFSCSLVLTQSGANGRWAYGEGTSFAAPLAAAVAAIAWQANPQLAPAQVAEVVKRSARQTVGAGWNQETGFGIVDALAALGLATRFDTTPPALTVTARPQPLRLDLAVEVADVPVGAQEAVGGITLTLEKSRDGVTFEPWLPQRDTGVETAYAASRAGPPYFFRATACDVNRNCTSQTAGPVEPVLVRPRVRLKPVLRKGVLRAVVVRLARPAGMERGRATVLVQARRGSRFRTIAKVAVPFGRAVRRGVRLGAARPVRLRALVVPRADWQRASSRLVRVVQARHSARPGAASKR